jgi:UDP-glucose:(heptosyl)LPS alpha-1,3-glucosyltransferase
MKIVLLKSGIAHRGGLEKWARLLLGSFVKRECEVTLLTTGPVEGVPPQVTVYSHKPSLPLSVLRVRSFDAFCTAFLEKTKADLVLGLDRNSFQTHLRAGGGVHRVYLNRRIELEKGLSSLRHGINPLHRTLLALEKRAFEHPELIRLFTNSKMVEKEILTHYRVAPEKISVIHNGVEWHQITPFFDEGLIERKTERFELLFVGQGFRRKGLERLLRGLCLIEKGLVHLSVVGKDKELETFQALSKRLGLSVTFYGEQKEMKPFYQKADALVIPSYYDPFANVTVEALAYGLFVVSSKYNGGAEVLTPETGCVIEDLNDDGSVAEAIRKALKMPKTLASASRIRTTVQSLDLSLQLSRFTELCLTKN